MLASLLPLVPHHHLDEDRFDGLRMVNESKYMSLWFICFSLLIGLVGRYLTVTICGEACPCPHSVVVTLFWIGNESEEKYLWYWIATIIFY